MNRERNIARPRPGAEHSSLVLCFEGVWNSDTMVRVWAEPAGSRIVAETIFASLMHDPDSYVNHPAAGLRLPEWEFPSGHDVIRSLGDLFSHSDELASF